MRVIQSLPSTLASAEYDLLCYYSSRRTLVEFLFAMAIPAIGIGRPKWKLNGRSLLDFFSKIGPFFKKVSKFLVTVICNKDSFSDN